MKTANAHIELADNADPALHSVSLTWQTWLRYLVIWKTWQTWLWWPKKFNVFIVALVAQKAFMSGPKTWQPWLQHLVTWKQSKFVFGDLKSEDKFQLDMFIKWIYPGIGLAFLFVTSVAVIHTFLLPSNVTKGAKKLQYPLRTDLRYQPDAIMMDRCKTLWQSQLLNLHFLYPVSLDGFVHWSCNFCRRSFKAFILDHFH